MRTLRARFKLGLGLCLRNEESLRAQALANKISCKDTNGFWKEVGALKIDCADGDDKIAAVWREKYKAGFDCISSSASKFHLENTSQHYYPVSPEEVCIVAEKLSINKSAGSDCIPAEVYRHGSVRLLNVLAKLFSMMLKYTHLPRELMKVTLVPILKCKTISPSESQNYRPIALPTTASKLL